jgi:stage V sporulation protein AE
MDYVKTFLVGGALCAVGQLLINHTKLTPARILVSFVVLGVALGGLGLYQPLVDFADCGASIPLFGFGNSIAKGTVTAIQENGLLGVLSGGLSATAAGISAAILSSFIIAVIFRPKEK